MDGYYVDPSLFYRGERVVLEFRPGLSNTQAGNLILMRCARLPVAGTSADSK
jgi:hypothetical protein